MENLKSRSGILEDYLLKNEKNNMSKTVKENTKNSKFASLDYEVLKYNEEIDLSLLKINLHTGRHHQRAWKANSFMGISIRNRTSY